MSVCRFRLKNSGVLGLLLVLLAGCGVASTGGQAGVVAPIIQINQSPEQVVTEFLNAWREKDYAGMYNKLSQQSQSTYSLPVFQKQYENVTETMQLADLKFQVGEAQIQGAAAAVGYNLTLTSPVFGTIDDKNRTMRLIEKPGGWGIAWSSMDIFDALAAGSRLEVRAQRSPRGNIYDRNGDLLVEENGTVIALYVAQQDMFNVDDCLTLFADVLRRQRWDLVALFANYDPVTIFYVGAIDPEVDAVRGAELDQTCAVRRIESQIRRYVGYGAAVHVTGYVGQIPADEAQRYQQQGYNSGDLVGLAGVEAAYETELSGQAEQVLRIVSPSGVLLRELAGKQGSDPQPVQLTIDRDLQLATAQAIADAYNWAEPNWAGPEHSPGAGAVVIDVKTGAVLAMVSYPLFDPAVFNPVASDYIQDRGVLLGQLNADSRQPFKNRAVQEQYFPGSTFKVITTFAAAAEHLMTPTELFNCTLEWQNGRKYGDTIPVRRDWRVIDGLEPAGEITISQALMASCNPFFYEMGGRLYQERDASTLMNYARQFGLGSRTGLEAILPEVAGNLNTPTSPEQAINTAIGQDIQVTILQMARMVAAVANKGQVYKPYLVEQVGGMDGSAPLFKAQPQVVNELKVDPEVWQIVHDGMCGVTTNEDLGTAYYTFNDVQGYTICGKTGTAQTGRVEPHGWFVSFAPADNPQIAIAVMGEFSREGSEVAAPITRRIVDAYFGQSGWQYPDWWNEGPYNPMNIPVGETGG
ncbi:MAG TPA: penicillin-binding transpeptidase domain-containing protein [Phototrophicaceae bacterium]|nr:penicillin-binding transpeptidase domain-containing protein [Phototrophicaceae bacterium]